MGDKWASLLWGGGVGNQKTALQCGFLISYILLNFVCANLLA